MAIKVTVNSVPTTRVSINNQNRETIRTVGVGIGGGSGSVATLTDVVATGAVDGATLVYDSNLGKYVVKTLPSLSGGTF